MNIIFWLIGLVIFLFLIYDLAPNYYARCRSPRVIRNLGNNRRQVALTFDDGPDPFYTPRLLTQLKENEVRATFFLIAEKAADNPDIVKRMISDGHAVGIHSRKHCPHWISTPRQTKHDIQDSVGLLHDLGVDTKLYRPPWGTFNLFTLHTANQQLLTTILWSVQAEDWKASSTVDGIGRKILRRLKPGDIILLHDGGGAVEAPKRIIGALETLLPELKRQGYEFVTLNRDVSRANRSARYGFGSALLRKLDHWLVKRSPWVYVPGSVDQLLYVDIQKYRGKPIKFDNVVIKNGDPVGEIHLDNDKLKQMHLSLKQILQLLKSELTALAGVARSDEGFVSVKAYWCRTVLHPFLTREGFTVKEISNQKLRIFLIFWENMLKYVYSTRSSIRLREPMECWISRDQLIERMYPSDHHEKDHSHLFVSDCRPDDDILEPASD